MAQSIYAGVDLHKTQFTTCTYVDEAMVEAGTKYKLNDEGYNNFISFLQDLKTQNDNCPVAIAIESTANARYFRDLMQDHDFVVVVVNTLRFKVVNLSTKKTDKNDAHTLVEFLKKDMLPQSHLCTPYCEGLRRILKSRSLLVQDTIALKNQAHAVMLAYGHLTQKSQFQSKKGRLKTTANLPQDIKLVLDPIFETLDAVESQIKILERRLKAIAIKDSQIQLLMTIPGVGVVNACTIKAYIDDINRFETYKNFSAFCGLVPWVQTSNETVYYGKITKRGPQELRTALVQCVVAMVRMQDTTKDLSIIRQYHELKEQKSSGKAIIATARKLSRIIYIMLKTGEPFNAHKLTP